MARGGLDALVDEARTGRPKAELTVTDAERAVLQRWSRRAQSSQVLAMHSKIVLACADGSDNQQIAEQLPGASGHGVDMASSVPAMTSGRADG
jgi:hypothetical protein